MNTKTITVIVIVALCFVPLGIAEHKTGYITPPNPGPITIPTPTVEEYPTGYIDPPHDEINTSDNLSDNDEYSKDYVIRVIEDRMDRRVIGEPYCIKLYPIEDSYVESENPGTNYGGADYLYTDTDIWSYSPDEYRRSYLKFDLSQIPVETNIITTIISANLKLYVNNIGSQSVNVGVYQTSNTWNEGTIIWDNTPSVNTSIIDVTTIVHDDIWYNWDVKDNINNIIGNDISFMIKSERTEYGYESLSFYSRDYYYGDKYPTLEVSYTLSCNTPDCPNYPDEHISGDVTGDGKVNIGDAVLLFNWVAYPNERGTTYILR